MNLAADITLLSLLVFSGLAVVIAPFLVGRPREPWDGSTVLATMLQFGAVVVLALERWG